LQKKKKKIKNTPSSSTLYYGVSSQNWIETV